MIKEKNKRSGYILIVLIGILLILVSLVYAQDWPAFNVCCEKTINGAWCQNAPESSCDTSTDPKTSSPYRRTPTNCEVTSFCRLGCCVDSEEGLCMENTPQKVCEIEEATWIDDAQCNVPQCSLGCCLLGDQASFVTLTRCKRLANIYGLETNFRREISDEASCILLAYYQDKGACVYEVENVRTCRFTSRAECLDSTKGKSDNMTSEVEFFKDYLCSADELATNCGPTKETMCVDGKFEVYFKDSCGNPANIYDSRRIYSRDKSYWQKIVPKKESCGYDNNNGNAGSKSCGNCEYLRGSICKEGEADFGDYACRDINCYNTVNGKNYRNGESWCVYQGPHGRGTDPVGSRHFRHVCIHGEETIEPCADFRNEVCIEEMFDAYHGNFIEAGCVVNRWSDCIDQIDREDCENIDKRDCFWIGGVYYDGSNSGQGVQTVEAHEGDEKVKGIVKGDENDGLCLPENPPGLEFWEAGNAKAICSLANTKVVVDFETNIWGTRKCKENCQVLEDQWVENMNQVCLRLGDCGNYINLAGRYTDDGIFVKDNGEIRIGSVIIEESSGEVVAVEETGGTEGESGEWVDLRENQEEGFA